MLRARVERLLATAAAQAFPGVELPEYTLEVPKEAEHGDLAANLAFAMAPKVRQAPRKIGEALVAALPADPIVARAEVAGAGFINFLFAPVFLQDLIPEILEAGEDWGRASVGAGQKVLVEFVSANPTGPMVVVSARAAAFGDSLCSLLAFAGYEVAREYYINDAGGQVDLLGASVLARLRELAGEPLSLPEGGYPGAYLVDVARAYLAEHGPGILKAPPEEGRGVLARFAVSALVGQIRQDLEAYGVRFDRFYSERQELHETGKVERVIELLREKGALYERDGALWLESTRYADDKDRVVRRSDGSATYFAADMAYHEDKFSRGFDHLIDILGPDHHGYVGRMKAAVQALGHREDQLEMLFVQWIRLVRSGKAVSMSKREGDIVPMAQLVSEVGKDAARFLFLMRSSDSPMDFDMDLAVKESNENPVFYVQYAHARIASILRQAEGTPEGDLALLQESEEVVIGRKLADFPHEIEQAALGRAPHHLTRYAMELATLFHSFYNKHRVLGVDPELSGARLQLVRAVKVVLKATLGLLGVEAPDSM